jgi:hypothetical protein
MNEQILVSSWTCIRDKDSRGLLQLLDVFVRSNNEPSQGTWHVGEAMARGLFICILLLAHGKSIAAKRKLLMLVSFVVL